ncbi:MAG: sedoheptulose 7-phosphate cyclase [Pirellulales bacterium]
MTLASQPHVRAIPPRVQPARVTQAYRLQCESTVPAYDVCLVEDLLGANSYLLARRLTQRRALVVTTPTVDRIYGGRLRNALTAWELDADVLVMPCDEASKTADKALEICQAAVERPLGRCDVLVSFGGGVVSDLVTLAASLVRRGIAHLRVPTTLIGQVDAGIGIKGGINFCGKKNILGCFHPPEEVLIDPSYLLSLGRTELTAGLAEIIKMAIVCDRPLFAQLAATAVDLLASGFAAPRESSREIIWRSCQLMLNELAPNIYEDQSYERTVDFGHTFSPKLESLSRYRLPHGYAVAADMAISAAIARELGLLPAEEFEAIVRLLLDLNLPVGSPLLDARTCLEALAEAARHRGGRPNLVVPAGIGSANFIRNLEELPLALLHEALTNLDATSAALADGDGRPAVSGSE